MTTTVKTFTITVECTSDSSAIKRMLGRIYGGKATWRPVISGLVSFQDFASGRASFRPPRRRSG